MTAGGLRPDEREHRAHRGHARRSCSALVDLLRATRSSTFRAARRRDRGRPADQGQRADADGCGSSSTSRDRARARRSGAASCSSSARTARAAARARPARPARAASALQVQVIGQQWAWTYRFPSYGGVRDDAARAAGRPLGRVPRHLARRDALVLGLRARRQGRRGAGRRQRRLRHTRRTGQLLDPLRRALRPLARLHVQTRRGRQRTAEFAAWVATERRREAPEPEYLPPYAPVYYPDPQRRAGCAMARRDRRRVDRLQPADGDRARHRLGFFIGAWIGSADRATARLPGRRPTRTTSPCCWASSSRTIGWLAGLGFLNYPLGACSAARPSCPVARGRRGRPLLPPDAPTTR